MLSNQLASKTASIALIIMFLLAGVLPIQPAKAANPSNLPGSLGAEDWAQMQALLPAAAIPNHIDYLKTSYSGAGDYFGSAISLSGDTLAVGAFGEPSNVTGVNGGGANNSRSDSGAAYGFFRSGAIWGQPIYLKASNSEAGDKFGYAVSGSGNTLVAGAISESSNAIGLNGDHADNSASSSGAAYICTHVFTIFLPLTRR